MMRSLILLSSAVGATMASSSSSETASAVVNVNAQHQQQWYPDFSSTYESGTCITSPASALRAMTGMDIPGMDMDFNEDAIVEYDYADNGDYDYYAEMEMEIMASATKEWCCAIWFPDQEGCGCLGGCPNNNNNGDDGEIPRNQEADADEWEEDYFRWTQDVIVVDAAPPSDSEEVYDDEDDFYYYYPEFDNADYEDGKCVKAVHVLHSSDFATKEGRPLHSSWLQSSLDGCCEEWFGEQESKTCLNSKETKKANNVDVHVHVDHGQIATSGATTSVNVTMSASKAVVC